MKSPEKNKEQPLKTIIRTVITTTVITAILMFAHIFPGVVIGKIFVVSTLWLMIFCIVYGGHWLELVFINKVKFMLPLNKGLFYFTRIAFWFLSSIPLFFLAKFVGNSLTYYVFHLGTWWAFGFFYIGIELFMHAAMHLRLKKSFYNGVY